MYRVATLNYPQGDANHHLDGGDTLPGAALDFLGMQPKVNATEYVQEHSVWKANVNGGLPCPP